MWRWREAIEKIIILLYIYGNGVARIRCHVHPSDSQTTKEQEIQNIFFFPFQKHIEEASQVLSDACDTITRFRRKTGIADSIVGIVKKCAVFKKYFKFTKESDCRKLGTYLDLVDQFCSSFFCQGPDSETPR